jgi:hypothetical protein
MLAAIAAMMLTGLPAKADDARPPGLITSSAVSTIVSTKDLGEGGEMWALWISMNPGVHVDSGQYIAKWAGISFVLRGSSVSLGNPSPGTCSYSWGGMSEDPSGRRIVTKPGDAGGCVYSAPAPYWEENRGSEAMEFAQLAVGGPAAPDDPHTGPDYERGGGLARAAGLEAKEFAPVNDALRAAGAMTLSVRQVTMPPGARIVVNDSYPALRMITLGSLNWALLPEGSEATAAPKEMFDAYQASWIHWAGARRIVITNETDRPAQFVEWSVAPAPGSAP